MNNQRNYYRILHVQMDAPESVIKSAYRTMMQTLRQHPDLGGDDWNASLLNEARSILLNPILRAQYDNKLLAAGYHSYRKHTTPTVDDTAGGIPNRSNDDDCTSNRSCNEEFTSQSDTVKLLSLPDSEEICVFCHSRVLWKPQQEHSYSIPFRCTRCDSPLEAVDVDSHHIGDDRRRVNRSYFEFCARIWLAWPLDSGFAASVCDWSTQGCSIEVNAVINNNQIVRVQSPGFDAVATVRHSHKKKPDLFVYGLQFRTLEIRMETGSIYSSVA